MVTIILTILISTYPWPIRPFGSAHQVSATLGDARESVADPRFHRGIDIPAGIGTKVYSIISDTAKWDGSSGNNAYVRVRDYWYIHLDSASRIPEGSYVLGILDTINTPPDTIGKVLDYPPQGPENDHLHFQIGNYATNGPYYNPLIYNGGPVGYDDTLKPVISSITFWRQGSEGDTAQQLVGVLNGRVDICARCQDRQTSGGAINTSGIYKSQYLIADTLGNVLYNSDTTIRFPQVQPPNNGAPVLLVYDRHHYTAASPFYYWVTNRIVNNQVIDRYWNTKQKLGAPDSVDAESLEVAKFKDGKYWVKVIAADIKNNADTESVRVTIANFRPKVKSTIPTNGQINVPLNQHIRIVFSESMDQNVALWQAISISPGVSGDWVWLSDKEIDFTPDPSFVRNTTYTVSLSSQLKDFQGQELIPYSFSFTTGSQPGSDNPQGYPTAFHWESAEPASWLDLHAYPYIFQFEDFYFYGRSYEMYFAVKTGNIWFSTPRYDLHFDLPTAGGDEGGVIAAYNDSITITGLNQGWIRQIKKYNPERKIIEWRYVRPNSPDTTNFEVTIYLNEYPGRFRYDYRKCDVRRFWNDGGSGISSGDGVHYFSITEKYGPVYTLAPASFVFTTDPPPGHVRAPAANYPLASEFVKLTWRQNPEPDLAGYIVYRRRSDSLSYRTLDTTTINNYTDTLVQLGRTYIYRVTAFDTLGLESTYSDSVIVKYGPREVDNPRATAYNNGRKIVSSPGGDKIHLVYSSGGGIYYCHSSDSGKSFSSSELVGGPGEYPALAIDNAGNPSASWVSGSYVYYTHWTSSWAPPDTIVLPVVNLSPPSMVCDTTDTVHLVFTQYYWLPSDTGDLIYMKFHKEHFSDAIVETLFTRTFCRMPSLVLDNSRNLHILWQGERCVCYLEKENRESGYRIIRASYRPSEDGRYIVDTIYTTATDERLYPVIDLYGNKIMTVWQDRDSSGNLEIYSRQKTDIGWQDIKKVATTAGESRFPNLSGGHYCLWQDNSSGNWEVYKSQYVDTAGSWTAPENISNTMTTSGYPHSAYSLVNPTSAKLYCLWTEGDTIPYAIKFKKLGVAPVAKIFADLGQPIQSQYCLKRDGYWIFGEKPYQTTDWGYDNLKYKFTGLDPEKVYRLDLAYYFENQTIGGNSGQIKAIEGNLGDNGTEVPTPKGERGIGRIIQALVVDGLGLDTIFITPNKLVRRAVWLNAESYADGEIIMDISKVKGKRVVCSEVGLYEFPVETKMSVVGGPQGGEVQITKPFYFDRIYPNPTKGMIKLRFNSPDERKITIKIYDVGGRIVNETNIIKSKIGMNEVLIKPDRLSAGVYFVKLETGGYQKVEKTILLR